MILRFLTILLITITTPAFAQDDVKNLSEILNPSVDFGNSDEPLTAAVMSKYFFKQCLASESLVLNDKEKELLCACQSSNMSENLTVEEFKLLEVDSIPGRNARGKAIAFGFTPCMEYVLDSKINRDCMKSEKISDVIFGKKRMCGCTTNRFKSIITNNGTYFIMDAVKHEPMNLNPLEHYFRQDTYFSTLEFLVEQCRTDIQFKLDRRQ